MICDIAMRRGKAWADEVIEDFAEGVLQHGDVLASGSFPVLKSVDRKLWDTIQHGLCHWVKHGINREALYAEDEFWKEVDATLWTIECTVDSHDGDPCLLIFHDSNLFEEDGLSDAISNHC